MSASANKLQPTVLWQGETPEGGGSAWRGLLDWLARVGLLPGRDRFRRSKRKTRATVLAGLVCLVVLTNGCGPMIMVAPRLDLAEYGEVGLIGFTVDNARGNLGQVATNRFAAQIFSGQDGVAIVELGEAHDVLREIDAANFNVAAYRLIGEMYRIPAVFLGHMEVSGVEPRASVWSFPGVEARVNVEITVRLVATDNGATLWSNSGRASATVGELGWAGGDLVFSAQNPDDAYGDLVDLLIWDLTADLRPTWVRD